MNKDELINKALACFKMTVDVKGLNQLEKYISDTEEENKRLKEEVKSLNKGLRKLSSKRDKWKNRYYKEKTSHEYDERAVEKHCDFVDKHYAQQNEFIKWIEDEINIIKQHKAFSINMLERRGFHHDIVNKSIKEDSLLINKYQDILSKYKEITGKNE